METVGWFRKIAAYGIASPLYGLGASRNHVIGMRLVSGIAAAVLLAAGPAWFALAGVVFLVGFMLAHADDEISRLSGNANPATASFAFYTEVLCNSLALTGLGIGLQTGASALKTTALGFPAPLFMGFVAAFAVAAVPLLAKRLEIIDGKPSPEFDGLPGFDGEDVTILLPIALWVGWAEGLLVLAAFGGIAFAGGIYMAHFRKYHGMA
ncbi:MAG: hypothetical protein V2J89_07875 [Halieaceae bacterium]|jgi:hypothetical protein|nr:hypothetical protein [Halieaceae bacterium]